jgi:hypothetical protein
MRNWWYVANNERKGPISSEDLLRLLLGGTLKPNSLVWTQGMQGWQAASQIDELASLLPSLPPEVPTTRFWSRRHFGSSVSLLLGWISVVGGMSQMAHHSDNPSGSTLFIAGVVMILGALAYRSAKKRRLGEVKSTLMRLCFEIGLLVLICAVIGLQSDLKYLIATDPVPNVIIPLWAIVAYPTVNLVPSSVLRGRARA